MEDVSSAPNHTGQLGPPGGPMGMNAKMNQEEPAQRPQYSIPGILHFIQHEWARFEMERAQWDVERAEFQVSVCSDALRLFRIPNTASRLCLPFARPVSDARRVRATAIETYPRLPTVDSVSGVSQVGSTERCFFIQTVVLPLAMASAGLKKQYGAQVYSFP